MVRINLIDPKALADQHLVAEYVEILMLLGYVKKHQKPINIPESYRLGPGHITFFKDKLTYLKKRHELIKKEMRRRKFKTDKTINLDEFPKKLHNDWTPSENDKAIIKKRLTEKLKMKPTYYQYKSMRHPLTFFLRKIREA